MNYVLLNQMSSFVISYKDSLLLILQEWRPRVYSGDQQMQRFSKKFKNHSMKVKYTFGCRQTYALSMRPGSCQIKMYIIIKYL